MGGGSIFTGNSPNFAAATPQFSQPATAATRSFHTPTSVTAIRSESNPCSQRTGDGVFGSVPSRAEVENAIVDLQRFLRGLSTSKPDLDGLSHNELTMLQTPGFVKFCDAFSMMENEPALRDLIVSLSCDKAVWEAILSNRAVQDLQGSISAAKAEKLLSYREESDIAILILKLIMGFTRSKILELVEKFVLLVNEIFQPAPKEKATSELHDLLGDKISCYVYASNNNRQYNFVSSRTWLYRSRQNNVNSHNILVLALHQVHVEELGVAVTSALDGYCPTFLRSSSRPKDKKC